MLVRAIDARYESTNAQQVPNIPLHGERNVQILYFAIFQSFELLIWFGELH